MGYTARELVALWRWRAAIPAFHPAVVSRLEHSTRCAVWERAADELEEALGDE
jgi:hypothetical protein